MEMVEGTVDVDGFSGRVSFEGEQAVLFFFTVAGKQCHIPVNVPSELVLDACSGDYMAYHVGRMAGAFVDAVEKMRV